MASTITVSNENVGIRSRFTRDGRKLTYRLNVIQQPERARACGQGAKASSDRRPVDPPPIVELHVFEGEGEKQQDITYSHKANFFLFATLESSRKLAHGRVSNSQQAASQPVLTGTPVAGMSYLDRPNPAGYFIFPDLSVRHEGQFRLLFTLYEELKDPKDVDADPTEKALAEGPTPHVHGRCDVRSTPFTVYSAKKFPGLAESTALSRTVADQGCRVRIRRDVRMRRRESKPDKDWDEYEEDTAAARAHATPTPDAAPRPPQTPSDPVERPLSAAHSHTSYPAPPSRRGSIHDASMQYQQAPPTAAVPQPPHYHQSEMASAVPPPPPSGYQTAQPGFDHAYPQHAGPYMQQQAHMPPPPQYPPQHGYAFVQPPVATPYGYMAQQPMYEQQQPNMPYGAPPAGPNYQSPMAPSYQQPGTPLGQTDNGWARPMPPHSQPTQPFHQPQQIQPAMTPGSSLPPLKTLEDTRPKMEPTSPNDSISISRVPSYDNFPRPAPPSQYVTAANGPAPKRAYGTVFDTQHTDQPLRSGARPTDSLMSMDNDVSDEEIDMNSIQMTYRRANGQTTVRTWPQYG